jgi:hypothetical protein
MVDNFSLRINKTNFKTLISVKSEDLIPSGDPPQVKTV